MADNLDLSALDIGVSKEGMSQYMEELKASLLVSVTEKLNEEVENMMTVINTGWQGVSRDRFETKLRDVCAKINTDLSAEYYDLQRRLDELMLFYYNQDNALIAE